MTLKKITAIILSAASVLSLAACGEKKENAGNPDDMPKEISISVYDTGQVPVSAGSFESNNWTQWIEQESGIKVNWVPIPRSSYKQKYATLISSGQMPDIITEFDVDFVASLVEQDIVQPVDEYIEKYSTTYKEYLNEHSELKPYLTFNDKMYAMATERSADQIINHGMWIRKDWLDKLGLEMPKTDEEFIKVAKAFKEQDPDGNGVNDTLGVSIINWHEIMPAMYFSGNNWYLEEDGKLKFGHIRDGYGDSLGFLKRLYDEGLIDPEFITDKSSQNQKQLWATGKTGILTYSWNETMNQELLANNPNANPVPLEPVATKYGKNGLYQEILPYKYILINKDAKNPKAVMEFIDWMVEKGWFNLKFGFEGENFQFVKDSEGNDVPQIINAEKNANELDWAACYLFASDWQVKKEWIPLMAAQDEISQKLAKMRAESFDVASKNKYRRDIPYNPPITEVGNFLSEFGVKRDEIRTQVIVGGSEYSVEWGMEKIREEWKRLGGEEIETLVNEWYQKNKDNFKSE